MQTALLILLAILPGIGICYYIIKADKHEPEDKVNLLIAFVIGAAITYPGLKLEAWGAGTGLDDPSSIWKTFLLSFGVVALTEETLKMLALLGYAFPRRFFNEPMDGIVYAVMIGMGFATAENLLYASQMELPTMLVRAFTSVPAHAAFAVIIGYFTGLAKFDPARKWKYFFRGILFAVLFHGAYDFFILLEIYEGLAGLALVGLIISIRYSQKLIALHQNSSPFEILKKEEKE